MKAPRLIADFECGEGNLKLPAGWDELPSLLRADLLKDWICDLDDAYCQARIDMRGGEFPEEFNPSLIRY